jgi:hypothetical protein
LVAIIGLVKSIDDLPVAVDARGIRIVPHLPNLLGD